MTDFISWIFGKILNSTRGPLPGFRLHCAQSHQQPDASAHGI